MSSVRNDIVSVIMGKGVLPPVFYEVLNEFEETWVCDGVARDVKDLIHII